VDNGQTRALVNQIRARRSVAGHPIVVGISGYGGSGKSTLARQLRTLVPGAVEMRGDDFLDPTRSHVRSFDWDGVDRLRLASQVLIPFREARPSEFQRWDWGRGALADFEPMPLAEVLIVGVIGLFHPEALPAIDLAVWCEVDLETATRRGMLRDEHDGHDHAALWRDVWEPNERDFDARFTPRDKAEYSFRTH